LDVAQRESTGLNFAAIRAKGLPPTDQAMTRVQTLEERKRARVEEIRAGLDVLRIKLTEYGRAHGGKFMMFGSAVNGCLH
jgi:hypothetical protein